MPVVAAAQEHTMSTDNDTHLPASEDDADITAETRHKADSDAALSPVIEQQGGAAIANLGKRRANELFKPD